MRLCQVLEKIQELWHFPLISSFYVSKEVGNVSWVKWKMLHIMDKQMLVWVYAHWHNYNITCYGNVKVSEQN